MFQKRTTNLLLWLLTTKHLKTWQTKLSQLKMAKLEKVENSVAEFKLDITPEKFEEGMKKAYNKNVKYINVPGFRKGKAPRAMIEKMYGAEIFYEGPDSYKPNLLTKTLESIKETEKIINIVGKSIRETIYEPQDLNNALMTISKIIYAKMYWLYHDSGINKISEFTNSTINEAETGVKVLKKIIFSSLNNII